MALKFFRLLLVSAAGFAALPVSGALADRDEIVLHPTTEQLRGLSDGSLVAVDNLGRRLEVDIEREHGRVKVKGEVSDRDVRVRPGPIGKVDYVPAAQLR